jgi:uncharacterized protein (DUF488 family)
MLATATGGRCVTKVRLAAVISRRTLFFQRVFFPMASQPMPPLFTIGHSTHPFDRFVALLTQHGIEVLADIRRFPGSRKFPQFNQGHLIAALPPSNIDYRWFEDLGGRRRKQAGRPSENLGLRNESFRNYADYMLTPEFRGSLTQLRKVAERNPTAMMCSEGLFWQCHRRLVSDFLLAKGITVQHILPSGELRSHTLTDGGRIAGGEVTYPPLGSDPTRLLFE